MRNSLASFHWYFQGNIYLVTCLWYWLILKLALNDFDGARRSRSTMQVLMQLPPDSNFSGLPGPGSRHVTETNYIPYACNILWGENKFLISQGIEIEASKSWGHKFCRSR